VTEIRDLHPPDHELPLASQQYAMLSSRKAVNHQLIEYLCAKTVREHECLGTSCRTAGEQLKGPSSFIGWRDG
jgi:hypothetical protein